MKVSKYQQPNYDGGLNDSASPSEIARNEASLLRNWDITFLGQLKRRAGLVEVGVIQLVVNKSEGVTVTDSKNITKQ